MPEARLIIAQDFEVGGAAIGEVPEARLTIAQDFESWVSELAITQSRRDG